MPTRRRNGFHKPFPLLQLCTWFYLPLLILQFLFFVSPILPIGASIPCTLIFFTFALGSAYFTYMACITDPIDVHLAKHVRETEPQQDTPEGWRSKLCYRGPSILPPEEEETKYCWVCETSVADHSMHCKYCNKCVSHFDHHCLWLNTCVGQANYGYFYKILWSVCCMLVVHTCCMLGIVIDMFLGGTSREYANDWFSADAWGAVAGVNIFFIVTNVICLSAVAQLLHFHIGLQKKNLTTYQFIITDNARRREAFQKKEERRSKRVAAVSKAKREGKQILGLRLEMGQYCCAACDALPADEEAPTAEGNGAVVVAKANEGTLGYAELSDGEERGTFGDDMASDRDLALMNATSLGESSSSQLEPLSSKEEVKAETSQDLTAENSKEESTGADEVGGEIGTATTTSPANNVQEETSSNVQEEVSNNDEPATEEVAESKGEDAGAKQEEPEPVEPEKEQSSPADNI